MCPNCMFLFYNDDRITCVFILCCNLDTLVVKGLIDQVDPRSTVAQFDPILFKIEKENLIQNCIKSVEQKTEIEFEKEKSKVVYKLSEAANIKHKIKKGELISSSK
ncbi:unnamed protein product [Brachionus calyciflorus]|uniref:Uncharacterized protein n=1 Tax=Brachionus calyciflorus TaxID=104777 RepID=A0A813Z8B8_9BILA|nr:unnamed protein product [Brachionus calyciflorus]